jgi:hypothetical protein
MMGRPMNKAGRYRDFFDLQLRFAEAAAVQTSTPMADAVLLYTNFHRRFGLGDFSRDGLNPAWNDYAGKLAALDSHEQRAGWTQAFYAQVPEGQPAFSGHIFGCFEFDADEETGIVRPHFYNRDSSGALGKARTESGGANFKLCSPISSDAFRLRGASKAARGFTARKPIADCFPRITSDHVR